MAVINEGNHDSEMPESKDYAFTRKQDWSKMSDDIIRLIVGKQRFYPHYRKFAATCSDWYRIAKEVHGPFEKNMHKVSLVLPYDNKKDTCALYQISSDHHLAAAAGSSTTYEFELPKLHDKFVYGCSRGWLVVSDNNFALSLINTMTHLRVDLPYPSDSIDSIKYFLKDDQAWMLDPFFKYNIISKVALSQSPSLTSGSCRVAAIVSPFGVLRVCQLGDHSWYNPTELAAMLNTNFDHVCNCLNDVLFFRDKLYAINAGQNVVIVEFDGPNYNARLIPGPTDHQIGRYYPLSILRAYLVDCSGSLLAVLKLGKFSRDIKSHKTHCFKLFQFEDDKEKWTEIHGLGDKSLFLGQNESISISLSAAGAQVRGCRPNCIYYADDFCGLQGDYDFGYRGDNGVFSCEDGTVQIFNISHSLARWVMPAVWCQLSM